MTNRHLSPAARLAAATAAPGWAGLSPARQRAALHAAWALPPRWMEHVRRLADAGPLSVGRVVGVLALARDSRRVREYKSAARQAAAARHGWDYDPAGVARAVRARRILQDTETAAQHRAAGRQLVKLTISPPAAGGNELHAMSAALRKLAKSRAGVGIRGTFGLRKNDDWHWHGLVSLPAAAGVGWLRERLANLLDLPAAGPAIRADASTSSAEDATWIDYSLREDDEDARALLPATPGPTGRLLRSLHMSINWRTTPVRRPVERPDAPAAPRPTARRRAWSPPAFLMPDERPDYLASAAHMGRPTAFHGLLKPLRAAHTPAARRRARQALADAAIRPAYSLTNPLPPAVEHDEMAVEHAPLLGADVWCTQNPVHRTPSCASARTHTRQDWLTSSGASNSAPTAAGPTACRPPPPGCTPSRTATRHAPPPRRPRPGFRASTATNRHMTPASTPPGASPASRPPRC